MTGDKSRLEHLSINQIEVFLPQLKGSKMKGHNHDTDVSDLHEQANK